MIRHSNPQRGPVHLAKVDLANGFYHVWLNDSAIPKLVVVQPKCPGEDQMIVQYPPFVPFVTQSQTGIEPGQTFYSRMPIPNVHPR